MLQFIRYRLDFGWVCLRPYFSPGTLECSLLPPGKEYRLSQAVLPLTILAAKKEFPETYPRTLISLNLVKSYLELASLVSFLNKYCNSYSCTNHWVVTHSDKTHHLYVSRY